MEKLKSFDIASQNIERYSNFGKDFKEIPFWTNSFSFLILSAGVSMISLHKVPPKLGKVVQKQQMATVVFSTYLCQLAITEFFKYFFLYAQTKKASLDPGHSSLLPVGHSLCVQMHFYMIVHILSNPNL